LKQEIGAKKTERGAHKGIKKNQKFPVDKKNQINVEAGWGFDKKTTP